jgi:hypothetical protein
MWDYMRDRMDQVGEEFIDRVREPGDPGCSKRQEAERRAHATLDENWSAVERLASALVEHETLGREEIQEITGVDPYASEPARIVRRA